MNQEWEDLKDLERLSLFRLQWIENEAARNKG